MLNNSDCFLFFQVGDEILEINDRSSEAMTHAEAVNLIRLCSDRVKLYIRRPLNPRFPGNF